MPAGLDTLVVMSDDSRYHMRRGQRERIVDVVVGTRNPPPRIAEGSTPELRPPAELGELAVPDITPLRFGEHAVVIEHAGDRVTLVLPGAIRVTGTVEDARRLAAALARSR